MINFALAVTVHDPEEKLLAKLPLVIQKIANLYRIKTAVCSTQTSRRTIMLLRQYGFIAVFSKKENTIGYSRTLSLKLALKEGHFEFIQYCDLDRLIYWQRFYPQELKKIITRTPAQDFTALSRTQKAWRTHPQTMIRTEKPANAAIQKLIGLARNFDFTSGSCLISRRAVEFITFLSLSATNATDLEWPALAFRELKTKPGFIACDGLSFETADYSVSEIQKAGSYQKWVDKNYNSIQAKRFRTNLSKNSIIALNRVLTPT